MFIYCVVLDVSYDGDRVHTPSTPHVHVSMWFGVGVVGYCEKTTIDTATNFVLTISAEVVR